MSERDERGRDEDTPVEASLEELIQQKAAEKASVDADADDDVLDLDLGRDDSLDPDALTVRALPQQDNEFTCRNCFLVKHISQLANAKKTICRDCA